MNYNENTMHAWYVEHQFSETVTISNTPDNNHPGNEWNCGSMKLRIFETPDKWGMSFFLLWLLSTVCYGHTLQ